MKTKLLNLCLIASSLIGYLEWGTNQKMFLIEVELDVIRKLFTDPMSILHPLVLVPLIGQIILLITLFQKRPSKILSLIGLTNLGILLVLIFFIGIIGQNYKTVISIVPFIFTGILVIRHHIKNSGNINIKNDL